MIQTKNRTLRPDQHSDLSGSPAPYYRRLNDTLINVACETRAHAQACRLYLNILVVLAAMNIGFFSAITILITWIKAS